jgi:lipid A ethanolaminephosphotransferase
MILIPSFLRDRTASPALVSLLTAIWIVLFDNSSFWLTFVHAQDAMNAAEVAATTGLALVLIFSFAAILRPFVVRRFGIILMAVLLVVSAGVAHYVDAWGVLFDKGLIRNMVQTDVREIRELASWSALLDIAWRGLLPATLLWVITLRSSSLGETLGQTFGLAFIAALTAAAVLATSYGILAPTFRNHRELRFQLVPTNYINAVYGYFKGSQPKHSALTSIAPDAVRTSAISERPLVLVLIVGETARAANFSLGGYARDTNAALNKTGCCISIKSFLVEPIRQLRSLACFLTSARKSSPFRRHRFAKTHWMYSNAQASTSSGSITTQAARGCAHAYLHGNLKPPAQLLYAVTVHV